MSTLSAARFVDDFFGRVLFQPDDATAQSALAEELAPDAKIVINGNRMTAADFTDFMLNKFRPSVHGVVVAIQDLDVVPKDEEGRTGVVAQATKYTTTTKSGQVTTKSSATTIVEVVERDGKRLIADFWEAQTDEV